MTIKIKPSHKGLLHKDLGVPQGKPIPAKKLAKAEHSSNPAERKRAQFAENAKHFNHSGGGKKRPNNPHGNPGHHPSTSAYEHSGYTHDSDDR